MALIYQYRREKNYVKKSNTDWIPWNWLKSPNRPRLTRALIFFIFISYQQFVGLLLTIIDCRNYSIYEFADDNSSTSTYRMVAEKSTICYVGSHLPAAIFSWILLFLLVLVLPFCLIYQLYQGFKKNLLETKEFRKRYGFMYKKIKPQFFYYRSMSFIYSFISACQIAPLFPTGIYVQIGVLLAMSGTEGLLLLIFRPMESNSEHMIPGAIISFKFLGCGLLFLTISQYTGGAILIVSSIICLVLIGHFSIKSRHMDGRSSTKFQVVDNSTEPRFTSSGSIEMKSSITTPSSNNNTNNGNNDSSCPVNANPNPRYSITPSHVNIFNTPQSLINNHSNNDNTDTNNESTSINLVHLPAISEP